MIARRHFHLTNRLVKLMKHNLITHKFYYGQGGQLRFDLTNRKYHIEVQTIWEDHCLLQIQGLTGIQNFRLQQQNSISYFDDKQLNNNLNQLISVKLKVPEDYTFNGTINGSLDHVNSQVGRNMRSKPFSLNILGNNHVLNMGNLKSQNISIQNAGGSVSFSGLTVQNGIVRANKIASKKIMTSKYLQLVCNELNIVSLLMFGPSKGKLTCKTGKIESVGGDCQIQAQKLRLDRYYGGDNSINIKCSAIQGKIGIQTGSGSIEFKDEQQLSQNRQKVLLGRLHKGKATVNKNKIDIL